MVCPFLLGGNEGAMRVHVHVLVPYGDVWRSFLGLQARASDIRLGGRRSRARQMLHRRVRLRVSDLLGGNKDGVSFCRLRKSNTAVIRRRSKSRRRSRLSGIRRVHERPGWH